MAGPVGFEPWTHAFFTGSIVPILNNTRMTWLYVELEINWEHKRVKYAVERMWLRGIAVKEVKEAILKGKKVMQKETGLVQAIFKRYAVVYDEKVYRKLGLRKIFPVTVKIL